MTALTAQYSRFHDIPKYKAKLIMADPPWTFKTYSDAGITPKGAGGQYDCMTLDGLRRMPVYSLAADNCFLWLWATNPMLPQAIDLMDAWGFKFKTAGHWSKKTKNNKQAFGTGYILRCAGEPFLIGTRGKPSCAVKNIRSVIEGRVRQHSRKPEMCYNEAERMVGKDACKIELFSRETREGWISFGNELGKFNNEHLP